jgi:uncharacterized protein
MLTAEADAFQGYALPTWPQFQTSGPLFAWNSNTAEIEFMREVNGDVIPFEVKSGFPGKLKSLNVFAERYKSKYRARISAHTLEINKQSRFHSYPLYLAGKFPL